MNIHPKILARLAAMEDETSDPELKSLLGDLLVDHVVNLPTILTAEEATGRVKKARQRATDLLAPHVFTIARLSTGVTAPLVPADVAMTIMLPYLLLEVDSEEDRI